MILSIELPGDGGTGILAETGGGGMKAKSLQAGIETMLRCGGSCSGCALSRDERQNGFLAETDVVEKGLSTIRGWFEWHMSQAPLEAATVFFGQGDHFLMGKERLGPFMARARWAMPNDAKWKTVCFMSLSAIGREDEHEKRVEEFYEASLREGFPFFPQVVFDPAKYMEHEKFKPVYLRNILRLKERFGMAELGVNLGREVPGAMAPSQFDDFVREHGFLHVEFNFAPVAGSAAGMAEERKAIFEWLAAVLAKAQGHRLYEINFMPIAGRLGVWPESAIEAKGRIKEALAEGMYVDSGGRAWPALCGAVGNLLPTSTRFTDAGREWSIPADGSFSPTTWDNLCDRWAVKISKAFSTRKPCASCKRSGVCAMTGAYGAWSRMRGLSGEGCPTGLDLFWDAVEAQLAIMPACERGSTIFDKNPAQHAGAAKDGGNRLADYFKEKRDERMCPVAVGEKGDSNV